MPNGVSLLRLHLMRVVYLLNSVLLGSDVWPTLLLAQFTYKVVWLAAVALPHWDSFGSNEMTQAMYFGLALDLLVIPWLLVWRTYLTDRGDPSRRKV